MTHWANDYIGQPWVSGQSDCWHFARRVWAERFGIDVPRVPWNGDLRAALTGLCADPERAAWVDTSDPAEGCGVMMAMGRRPCHVGIWIEPKSGPQILHSVEHSGVIATPPPRLKGLGYRVLGYYRRRAAP